MSDLAVVIPTFRRADQLRSLLTNIATVTTTPHRVYLVVENSDRETAETLPDLPDHVAVFGDFGSCAKAWNAGFMASDEPYVFVGNDDIRFHPAWDTEALKAKGQVIGTNDGHGRMFCFALVKRAYIEQHSGVYDKPATLVHEYLHNYVDTELSEYAKHRGVWAEAPTAITEHLHWEYGKADRDHPNYKKGQATVAQDHATFQRRKREWTAS